MSDKATLSWDGGSCTDQHAKWGGCLGVESSTAVVTNVAMARMSAEEGGSVFVQLDAVLELHHVSITDSHATSQAGCAYVYGHSRLTLDSTTWTGCSSDGDAGALWIASGDFYMRNASRIEAATAARDGGAIYALAGGSDIARIYLLEGSSIEDVQAEGVGGAALISEESFMVCSDSSITNGRAPTADGGGIAKIAGGKTTGALVLQNCQISNCAAGNRGGALTSDAPVFIIGDTHLTNNSAALDGGAVALHFNAKLQVAGAGVTLPNVGITFPQSANATVSIVGNTAHMCGGGVYADDEAMIVLGSGAVIKDNQAAKGEQLCLAQGLGGDFSVANTSSSLPGASVTGDVRVVDVEFAKVLAEKHVFGALGGAAPVGNPRWLEATYAGNGSLSIQPRERLPRLTVAAMDAFGNKLRPDYQHPVIVRLQAWRMAQNATSSSVRPVESYPLSGESIKAIIDEDTHEVTFDGLSISGEPAHYAILVTAVPGTIEVRSGDPNVSISFEIGLCDPQTQRYIKLTAAENGSCYPIMAVPWFIRFVFAAVGVVCILITLTLMFLIFKHRDIQIVKSGSPVLTLIACGGSCLSFLSLPARLLPDQWGCTAAAWLDNLGFYAFFTVIILKTYRIEVIFNKAGMRRSEAEKVRNAALLRHVAVIMFFVTAGLVIWTIVSPPIPNASTITVGFVPVDRCTSSPFSVGHTPDLTTTKSAQIGFLLFRLIFQAAGTYLAVLVRNVVAAFNERYGPCEVAWLICGQQAHRFHHIQLCRLWSPADHSSGVCSALLHGGLRHERGQHSAVAQHRHRAVVCYEGVCGAQGSGAR